MVVWKKQDAAWVGSFAFVDGQQGGVVLLADSRNPKGAFCLVPEPGSPGPKPIPFAELLPRIAPDDVIRIVCRQERAFGARGLPRLKDGA